MTAWISKNKIGFTLVSFIALITFVIGGTYTYAQKEIAQDNKIEIALDTDEELREMFREHIVKHERQMEEMHKRYEDIVGMKKDISNMKDTLKRIEGKL